MPETEEQLLKKKEKELKNQIMTIELTKLHILYEAKTKIYIM